MTFEHFIHLMHDVAYVSIALLAAYAIYLAILVTRQIRRRKFRNEDQATEFTTQISEMIRRGDFEGADEACTAPENWYKAVAFLAQGAIEKRNQGISKVKQNIATRFSRDILANLELVVSNMNMVIKVAPMMGLFGTVVGMIGAFSRIASMDNPNPKDLMGDMSIALNCTAMGLAVCIPMLLVTNFYQNRIRKFEDNTFEHIQTVVEDIEGHIKSGHTAKA